MPSDRRRILELALDSLNQKKKILEEEIAELTRELRGGSVRGAAAPAVSPSRARKKMRFSKEERLRRSQRMKAYWDNWRKKKGK